MGGIINDIMNPNREARMTILRKGNGLRVKSFVFKKDGAKNSLLGILTIIRI